MYPIWRGQGPPGGTWRRMALALAVAGCSGQTLPATNVTSSSATLNGSVQCDHAQGTIWWELRRAGRSGWQGRARSPPTRAARSRRSWSRRTSRGCGRASATPTGWPPTRRPPAARSSMRPRSPSTPGASARGWCRRRTTRCRPPRRGPGRRHRARRVRHRHAGSHARQRRRDRGPRRAAAAAGRLPWPHADPGPGAQPGRLGRRVRPGRDLLGQPHRRPSGGPADRVRQRDLVRLPVRRHLLRAVLQGSGAALRDPLRGCSRCDRVQRP